MKKEGKTKTESEEEFNLKDVIALGGDKEDYEMLKDVESGAKSTQNTDTFNQSEFESLIKELGFSKYHEETKVNCDEPKKSLKSVQEKEVSGTVDSLPPLPIDLDQMPSKLLIKSNSLWHEIFTNDPPDQGLLTKPYADILQTYGNKLYENEVMLHKNKSESRIVSSSGNAKWMNTVAKAGTLSDRVAALSLMVQEAPVHNLSSFEQLCSMSKKKGKREAFMALEAIRDLLLGDLLPNGRKLKTFNQQAINTLTLSLQAKDCSG
uniref:Uncharacterized protein n=1 Tax=Ciona savignyi TaxID=51511 RepID=H2YRJ8_CIOSA